MGNFSDFGGCRGYQATGWSRRGALKVGSLALGGLSLADLLRMEQARGEQKWYESKEGTAKSVIQIVCQGGISAQESWNPKPESPTEYRGPFGVAKTPIPGVVFSETLPACAKIADKMCVVRSVVGSVPDHALGMYHMLSGHRSSPAIKHPQSGRWSATSLAGEMACPHSSGFPVGTTLAAWVPAT